MSETNNSRKYLLQHAPSIIFMIVAIIGFYFTTTSSVAENTKDIQYNARRINIVDDKVNELQIKAMTKEDFMRAKEDLIREFTNHQLLLQETNRRLDQLILKQP